MLSLLRLGRRHAVGLLALFIAIGGTAYAASLPRNSVGTAQLRNGAVTSAKVKNRSLRRADFARGQLRAGPAGPRGAKGDPGQKGDTGARGLKGDPGPRGPSNAFFRSAGAVLFDPAGTEIMRFTTSDGLPDGSAFAVVAKVVAGAENANTSALQCALRATGTGTMIDESLATSPASGSRSVLVMQGPVKTGTGVTGVDVVCSASGGVGPQGIALLATLSLIQVASVTGP